MAKELNFTDIPSSTGVYIFYAGTTPIYVGKAVNLKARLISHVRNSKFDNKEAKIIEQATQLDFILIPSEFEALLKEAELIRVFRPKYNVSWKDDKSYLYIKINQKEKFPKLKMVRKENDGKSLYFGPFTSARISRLLLYQLRKIVPFCTQKSDKRKCFYAHIGLCNPCPGHIMQLLKLGKKEEAKHLIKIYQSNIQKIITILRGGGMKIIEYLEKELELAIKREDYEHGLNVRNRLIHLKRLLYERSFDEAGIEKSSHIESDIHEEIGDFLSTQFGKPTKDKPYRIECYDVSNLFGKDATASMVVFNDSQSDKTQYRRFKIKWVKQVADTKMLTETLQRRFHKKGWQQPDLIVVDGGRPQVTAVAKVLYAKKLTIPLIGLAKKPDRIILHRSQKRSFKVGGALFMVLKAVRDESHRFARNYHLLLRNKDLLV